MPIAPSRIYHVNINCSILDRSLAFYCDLVGLKQSTRTAPTTPQPGGAFGLDQVQWDAWILQGDKGNEGVVLDLLEWKVPTPVGEPARDATTAGFNRLCIATADLDAMHARLVAAGADCWTAPTDLHLGDGATARMFVCGDPDGTQIEFVAGSSTRLSHIAINCADFARSQHYYRDVIGLQPARELNPPRQPGVLFRIAGEMELRTELLRDPVSGFMVELIDWLHPTTHVEPARVANQLGIFRMAWVTKDIAQDYRILGGAGVSCYSPPGDLSMGPGLPDLQALFWGDPDGACLELIQSPGAA
ncbi:MAG TPA: VOC family protein [Acidimicrobiales bacterium]|nr:VOC family protein [Acidimicrobiales bacterium]